VEAGAQKKEVDTLRIVEKLERKREDHIIKFMHEEDYTFSH
jgi:hypothetical protein